MSAVPVTVWVGLWSNRHGEGIYTASTEDDLLAYWGDEAIELDDVVNRGMRVSITAALGAGRDADAFRLYHDATEGGWVDDYFLWEKRTVTVELADS